MEYPTSLQTSEKGKLRKRTQLKKWFLTKICEYSRGRQLIHKLTGNVGVEVIDAVQSIVLKHSGRAVADDLLLQLYKVICKAGVLIVEKEITEEMMRPCKQPNIILMFCLIEQLQEPVMLREAAVLFELLEESYSPLLALLSRFEGSGRERLQKMKTFLTSTDVVEFFLISEETSAEREVILQNMRAVMLPYHAEVLQVTRVARLALQSRRVELVRLVTRPCIVDFLRNGQTFPVLCDWFAANRGATSIHWLYFYKSAREYGAVTSRSLMSQRAGQLQHRYLRGEKSKCPISLPPEMHQRLTDRIDLDEFSHGLFAEAISYTVSVLKDDFALMLQEGQHFAFLRDELSAVENKLRALSRQEHLVPDSGGRTSGQSMLRPDVLLDLVCDSDTDMCTDSRHSAAVAGNGNKRQSISVDRMSFWN